jgi:peptide/nickel transport system substrate-binding protein
VLDPTRNQTLRAMGKQPGSVGPPTTDWRNCGRNALKASDSEARQEIAMAIQLRAFETVPFIPTGAWKTKTAYRKKLRDLLLFR